MTNYNELSDFEINQLVAVALGAKEHCRYEMGERSTVFYELNGEPIDVRKGFKGVMNCLFDPCNDPKSAWPIIVANRIDITFDAEDKCDVPVEWCRAQGPLGHECYVSVDKALRAAMVVYLMMQEQQHDR